jgi:queuine tRNA-ribosyltransferase
LRHLFVANEVTSVVLLTVHNVWYFLSLMREAREAIMAGRYTRFRAGVEHGRNTALGRETPTENER